MQMLQLVASSCDVTVIMTAPPCPLTSQGLLFICHIIRTFFTVDILPCQQNIFSRKGPNIHVAMDGCDGDSLFPSPSEKMAWSFTERRCGVVSSRLSSEISASSFIPRGFVIFLCLLLLKRSLLLNIVEFCFIHQKVFIV